MGEKYTQDELVALADRLLEDGFCGWKPKEWAAMAREYAAVLAERDTLAAELVALRAGLPRWKQDDDGLAFRLTVGPIERWVEPCANGWRAPFLGVLAQDRDTSMKLLTDSLGLPPCEVEGE